MAMEALSHPLGASEYFTRRSKRGRSEEVEGEDFCFNEDDMELASSLMMLAKEDNEKKDEQVEVFVHVPPCTAALTESMPVNDGQCYKCSVCGKEFGSYQALGGHKSSHWKSVVASSEATVEVEKLECGESNERVHECSICHKRFPSGQALGGHKRRHYEGPLGKHYNINKDERDKLKLKETNNTSEVTTATNSDGARPPVMHWEINLNLPALPEFWPVSLVVDVDEEVQSLHPVEKPCQLFHFKI